MIGQINDNNHDSRIPHVIAWLQICYRSSMALSLASLLNYFSLGSALFIVKNSHEITFE